MSSSQLGSSYKPPRKIYHDPDEDDSDQPTKSRVHSTSTPPHRPLASGSTRPTMEAFDLDNVPSTSYHLPSRPSHPPHTSQTPRPSATPVVAHRKSKMDFVDLTRSPPVLPKPAGHMPLSKTSSSSSTMSNHSSSSQSSYKPLGPSGSHNHPFHVDDSDRSFGSSIPKKGGAPQLSKSVHRSAAGSQGWDSYIKPATPNGFSKKMDGPSKFAPAPAKGYDANGWPTWVNSKTGPYPGQAVQNPQRPVEKAAPAEEDDTPREQFDIDAVPVSAEDMAQFSGDADEHMRELLSGAIGDGEDDMGDDKIGEGEDVIEGFAKGMKLMPHQVRGVKWMRGRESGRKYGGILADDMGLGKTVQTLARIVEGIATAAEKKAGFKAGTLIVAPLAVMEQWATECNTKTRPGQLKVTTHHGPSRTKSGKVLEKFDVVITTFQTLASEHGAYQNKGAQKQSDSDSDSDSVARRIVKKKTKKQAASALFEVKWLRIVVDEAQNIKNKGTKASKAAVALRAKYRWCLTGTPIQNNVDELFSLFAFLRAKPLDNWETFRQRISSLVKDGRTKLAMKRLHVVLKAVMLRRTKDATIDGKPILNLPARTVNIVPCEFDNEERVFYKALEEQTALSLNKFVRAGTVMNNYTSVLTMLLRLRQACDHPSLVTKALTVDADAINNKGTGKEEKDQADDLADLLGGLGVSKDKTCEVCFTKLEAKDAKYCSECESLARKARAVSMDSDGGLPLYSAKIRMLVKLLADVHERSEGKEKTIVFSQFTSFLNLVEPFLQAKRIKYVRYDGSMKNEHRQENLEAIKTDPTVKVILISFKAGSTGLNLTCCNNVILMDLWWNPALEDQAFDRAHRLGQKLDVNIYKLTIEETVEDRILHLQKAKRELAKAALSGQGAKNMMKLTLNDIMALFKSDHRQNEDSDTDTD